MADQGNNQEEEDGIFQVTAKRPRQRDEPREVSDGEEEPPEEEEDNGGIYDDDEDYESCPICLEAWTTSGSHRLCSLRCGHLFGRRCIERWLALPKSTPSDPASAPKPKCPQCNLPARRSDIRVLYTKRKLVAIDIGEREALVTQLEAERSARRQAVEAEAQANLGLRLVQAELDKALKEMGRLKSALAALPSTQSCFSWAPRFNPKGTRYGLCQVSGQSCRSLDYDPYYGTFLATMTKAPGQHGILKLSMLDGGRPKAFVPVHQEALKTLAHSPFKDGLVLSTGGDARLALTSIASDTVLQAYPMEAVGWSCAFDPVDRNCIYAGLGNGVVAVYDLRQTSGGPLETWKATVGRPGLPIHSLQVRPGGRLLGATMDGFFMTEGGSTISVTWSSDLRASCTSMRCADDALLLSYRMMPVSQPATHFFFRDIFKGDTIAPSFSFRSASGQTVLRRSALLPFQQGKGLLALISDQQSASLGLYDLTGCPGAEDLPSLEPAQKLPTTLGSGPILDVAHAALDDGLLIGALTDRDLFLYQSVDPCLIVN